MIILHDIPLNSDCILWANDTDWAAKEPLNDGTQSTLWLDSEWWALGGPDSLRPSTQNTSRSLSCSHGTLTRVGGGVGGGGVSKEYKVLLPSGNLQLGRVSTICFSSETPFFLQWALFCYARVSFQAQTCSSDLCWVVLIAVYRHQEASLKLILHLTCCVIQFKYYFN